MSTNGSVWCDCSLSGCSGQKYVCFIAPAQNKEYGSRNAESIKVDALALNAFSHVWLFKTNNRGDETGSTFLTRWGPRAAQRPRLYPQPVDRVAGKISIKS